MTIRTNIKCDCCPQTFMVRMQMDNSIHHIEWPLYIECPNCHNVMDLVINKEAKLRYRTNDAYCAQMQTDGEWVISYSASLPVPKDLYMKHNNVFNACFSPFMTIFMSHRVEDCIKHGEIISRIIKNILPHKSVLKELLPMLQHGANQQPFAQKMMNIFELGQAERTNYENLDCGEAYLHLLEVIYRNLQSNAYTQFNSYYDSIIAYIDSANTEDLQEIVSAYTPFGNLQAWLLNHAYDYVADIIDHIECYFPSMFYANVGDYDIPHDNRYAITTLNVKTANKDYAKGFETLVKILPLLAALDNKRANGSSNTLLKSDGTIITDAIHRFEGKMGGDRKNEIQNNYPRVSEFLKYTLENHIRNGEDHLEVTYDTFTQNITYKYNINNPNAIHQEYLIDVGLRVYLQLMHMMEICIIINQINRKLV